MKYLILLVLAISVLAGLHCGESSSQTGAEVVNDSARFAEQQVENGRYLAVAVAACMDCHSPRDPNKFSMPVMEDQLGSGSPMPFGEEEGIPGKVWPPNLTPYALGSWTDEEIIRAFTRGITKSGDTLFPLMPYHNYSRMTREDANAIVAFLRTLKPIEVTRPKRELAIPASMFGPLPEGLSDNTVKPDKSDKVKYGEYIITQAVCGECHTPRNEQGVPMFDKAFSGGFTFKFPHYTVTVANITPDSATGIGTWTEEMFLAKFRNNSSPEMQKTEPGKNNTVMPWGMYGKMSDEDLKAIYAYLRTVPPVKNKVEKWKQ